MENLELLVQELASHDVEQEWFEFKVNNYEYEMVGKDISALSNAATYCGRECAYMIWGVDDKTHQIVGTTFCVEKVKAKQQELQSYLRTMLSSNVNFEFHSIVIEDKNVVVLIIYKATMYPVSFQKVDYIRVGSYTKKLIEHPTMAAKLWENIRGVKFEEVIAKSDLTVGEALNLIHYSSYFELIGQLQPTSQEGLVECMLRESIMVKQDNGLYAITNLGAILFARQLSDFSQVERKALRIVQYKGNHKLEMLKEHTDPRGYAVAFESVV